MDIFVVHAALMEINEKPISIAVISILKHVFAGRNCLNLKINMDFSRSKRIFSTYDSFCPRVNDAILSKYAANNGLEMLFLCTRKEYIFYDKRVIYWEQVILNGIPTLLNLTYLATLQMIQKRKNTVNFLSHLKLKQYSVHEKCRIYQSTVIMEKVDCWSSSTMVPKTIG
jgi:hypothetical protein